MLMEGIYRQYSDVLGENLVGIYVHGFSYSVDPSLLCGDGHKVDYDLAAHFTVIRRVGIVLCGKPICDVFSDVPVADYLDSGAEFQIDDALQVDFAIHMSKLI